jgi:hypothetical protein
MINKKSQFDVSHELVIWIPRIILIAFVVVTVFYIISLALEKNFEVDKIQQAALRQRFVYSENCLAYKDNEKIYPGIIDKSKFNLKNLENCFQTNQNMGVNLNLISDDTKTINLNEQLTNMFDFCIDEKNFACTNHTYYVLIKDNELKPELLNIAIIKRK